MIRQQAEDGSFKEKFVYNGEYQRKLPVEFQEIALTAHVMIALSPFIEKVWILINVINALPDFHVKK